MAKTREQILEAIEQQEEKIQKRTERYEKALDKIEKGYNKEMNAVPFEKDMMVATEEDPFPHWEKRVWQAEDVQRKWEREANYAQKDYEYDIKRYNEEIARLQKQLAIIEEKKEQKAALEPIPELVEEVARVVNQWLEWEKDLPEDERYYSKLSEEELQRWVIDQIAQEITNRCWPKIGKIDSFSKLDYRYGEIEMTCKNEEGETCSLWATPVVGHERTSIYGKSYTVRPHIRTLTT